MVTVVTHLLFSIGSLARWRRVRASGVPIAVFTHSYRDDLKAEGEGAALTQLVAAHDVALVDMGHTHYNELANDGRTTFTATRSTSQIEEGRVGYARTMIDDGKPS